MIQNQIIVKNSHYVSRHEKEKILTHQMQFVLFAKYAKLRIQKSLCIIVSIFNELQIVIQKWREFQLSLNLKFFHRFDVKGVSITWEYLTPYNQQILDLMVD